MRALSAALTAALEDRLTAWAVCWRLARVDGVAMGFTTHDRTLVIDGMAYRSAPSFLPSALKSSAAAESDAGVLKGALTSDAIRAEDLDAGLYDGARVSIFLIDWTQTAAGRLTLFDGWFAEVTRRDGAFEVGCRSVVDALQQPIIPVYTPECRADWGDKRCRVNRARYQVTSRVRSVLAADRVTADGIDPTADFYAYGRLRWLTGGNAGRDMEVLTSLATEITLRDSPAMPLQPGDLFSLTAGCDKRFATCRDRFANQDNFRGEPDVPGNDLVFNYPGV